MKPTEKNQRSTIAWYLFDDTAMCHLAIVQGALPQRLYVNIRINRYYRIVERWLFPERVKNASWGTGRAIVSASDRRGAR